jgi:hypothetical protein
MLHHVFKIPQYDMRLPDGRHIDLPDGDWVVRGKSTATGKLKAIEAILTPELCGTIHFEKRTVNRDAIVVTGRYALTPLPGKDPNRLHIFVHNNSRMGNGKANSLGEFLLQLGDAMCIPFDDRTEPGQTGEILFSYEMTMVDFVSRDKVMNKETDLPILLGNLAKQTGLQFKVEKRPAEVWFVVEDAG